jgi:hypothetical protein
MGFLSLPPALDGGERDAERRSRMRQGQMRDGMEAFNWEGCSRSTKTLALRPGAF